MNDLPLDEQAQIAVSNGVQLLNEHFGDSDWMMDIDTETLTMVNLENCVLGQLFGHYHDGVLALSDAYPETGVDFYQQPYIFGFDSLPGAAMGEMNYFELLTDEWLFRLAGGTR